MDISDRNSISGNRNDNYELSSDGGESAGQPGHNKDSSPHCLHNIRRPGDCYNDSHICRTGVLPHFYQ